MQAPLSKVQAAPKLTKANPWRCSIYALKQEGRALISQVSSAITAEEATVRK